MEWAGKRVLVTGAGGFIGSHLVERLLSAGALPRALVRYSSSSNQGWLDQIPEGARGGLEVVFGDVRDSGRLAELVDGCEVIFHLAALISIPYSYEAPASYVDTNVQGTLNVLEAARQQSGTRVVQTSTSEVYGTPESVPITERHPLRAQSPYAASKIGADKLAESFHLTYGLPVTILRPFNTYGPRQSTRAVLPTILTQLLAGRRVIHLGALSPRRDLTYVADTVEGFLHAAACQEAVGRVIQLGTGRDISIGELADLAMKVIGVEAEVICEAERLRPPTSEVERLLSDPRQAADVLGWQPHVPLEEGIRLTANWLQAYLGRYEVGRYAV